MIVHPSYAYRLSSCEIKPGETLQNFRCLGVLLGSESPIEKVCIIKNFVESNFRSILSGSSKVSP